jgi:hypothetical protein
VLRTYISGIVMQRWGFTGALPIVTMRTVHMNLQRIAIGALNLLAPIVDFSSIPSQGGYVENDHEWFPMANRFGRLHNSSSLPESIDYEAW